MNKDEFIGFMQTPSKLNAQTISGLAALVRRVPVLFIGSYTIIGKSI